MEATRGADPRVAFLGARNWTEGLGVRKARLCLTFAGKICIHFPVTDMGAENGV